MKIFNSVVSGFLESDYYQSFLLLELGPTRVGSWIRMTTLASDVVFNGSFYTSQDILSSIDPPKLSSNVDREIYKITLADATFSLRPFLEEGITNTKMTVRAGFINTFDAVVGGAAPGHPCLNIEDTIIAYRGSIDSYMYEVDAADGAVALVIEGSSPMGALGLTRSILTSREWLRSRYPLDTSFDQVYVGSLPVTKKWGKK